MQLTFTTVCKLPISQFQLRIFISIQPLHKVAINISYYFTVYADILFKTYLLHKLPSVNFFNHATWVILKMK